jgi:hypothetical protein
MMWRVNERGVRGIRRCRDSNIPCSSWQEIIQGNEKEQRAAECEGCRKNYQTSTRGPKTKRAAGIGPEMSGIASTSSRMMWRVKERGVRGVRRYRDGNIPCSLLTRDYPGK